MIINEVLYFGDYSIMIALAIFQMENISKVEPQYLENQYLKYHGYVDKRNLVLPTTYSYNILHEPPYLKSF